MVNGHQIIEFIHLNTDLCSSTDDSQSQAIFGSNIMLIWYLHPYNTIQYRITITEIKAANRVGKLVMSTFELSLILHDFNIIAL